MTSTLNDSPNPFEAPSDSSKERELDQHVLEPARPLFGGLGLLFATVACLMVFACAWGFMNMPPDLLFGYYHLITIFVSSSVFIIALGISTTCILIALARNEQRAMSFYALSVCGLGAAMFVFVWIAAIQPWR